jgi:hypothetical protein
MVNRKMQRCRTSEFSFVCIITQNNWFSVVEKLIFVILKKLISKTPFIAHLVSHCL